MKSTYYHNEKEFSIKSSLTFYFGDTNTEKNNLSLKHRAVVLCVQYAGFLSQEASGPNNPGRKEKREITEQHHFGLSIEKTK